MYLRTLSTFPLGAEAESFGILARISFFRSLTRQISSLFLVEWLRLRELTRAQISTYNCRKFEV